MFEKILVVCHGNICRSPVGEALLKKALPNKRVESAGLGALVGNTADTTTIEIGEEEGLDLSDHRSRQITIEMIQWADVILVMSEEQRAAVGRILPTAIGKTLLFGQWLTKPVHEAGTGMDIPDPYRKSREAYAHVQQLLSQAANEWQEKLK